jgi:ABC-2 type transport system permease protein
VNSGRFVFVAAAKDLRRRLADPAALLMWIGLPVVIGGLLALITGGSSGPEIKAHLLVADQDNTLVSRLLVGAGRQGQLGRFLELEEVALQAGERRIQAGEGSALLIVPRGFQDAVLQEQPTQLTVITNPSERILPQIVVEGLGIVAEATFYLQRLVGVPVRAALAGRSGSEADVVAAVSRSISEAIARARGTLVPPLIALDTRFETDRRGGVDFGALLIPGLLFMSLLFTANGMSLDVWIEKERGTLRRSVSTPRGLGVFLAGKLVAALVLMAAVVAVALGVSAAFFAVPLARLPLAFAWSCYAGAALFCFFILIQVSASTFRAASVLSQMVVLPLMMIGGSFFPFEIMPGWMANIGRWTPNGLAVTELKAMLFTRPDLGSIAVAALAIGIPAALAFALAARRMRRGFVVA